MRAKTDFVVLLVVLALLLGFTLGGWIRWGWGPEHPDPRPAPIPPPIILNQA